MFLLNRNEKELHVCWHPGPSAAGKGLALHIAFKVTLHMSHDACAEVVGDGADGPLGDTLYPGDAGAGLYYPNDFTAKKPRGEILVAGSAYPPEGGRVAVFRAGVQAGPVSKEISVFGPRQWETKFLSIRPGPPAAAIPTPLSYRFAFGGPEFPMNPIGCGREGLEMPRIERLGRTLESPSQILSPAGLGAIPMDWAPRAARLGSFGSDYVKTRWPWWPQDFDRRFFQTAPDDQQRDGYWNGSEELVFFNLHPTVAELRTSLPGMRPRCFVRTVSNWTRGMPGKERHFEISETALELDTIWANPSEEKIVLNWRGETAIRSIVYPEIHTLWCCIEPAGGTSDIAEAIAADVRVLDALENPISAPDPEPPELPSTPESDVPPESSAIRQVFSQAVAALGVLFPKQSEAAIPDTAREAMAKMDEEIRGVASDAESLKAKSAEAEARLKQFEEMQAKASAETANFGDGSGTPDAEPAPHSPEAVNARLEELEKKFADLEASLPRSPRWEDFIRDGVFSVDVLRAQGGHGVDFRGAPLAGLDLSRIDFSGAVFNEMDLAGANFSHSSLEAAALSGCDLNGCQFCGSNLSFATLAQSKTRDTAWDQALCGDTTFEGLDFRKANLSGIQAPRACFRECQMQEVDLSKSLLAMADFPGSDMSRASFHEAILSGADLSGCRAPAANFSRCHIESLRTDEATILDGAIFHDTVGSGANLEGANLSGCDFSGSDLRGSRFVGSMAASAVFAKCDLRKSTFDDAGLTGCVFLHANLMESTFDRANCTSALFDGGNLFDASFWESDLSHATWHGAYTPRSRFATKV